MPRAHCYRPLQNQRGDLLVDATVEVVTVTGDPLAQTLYAGPDDATSLDNPQVIETGILDFWLAVPMFVTLKITPSTGDFFSVESVLVDTAEGLESTDFNAVLAGLDKAGQGLAID